MSAYEALAQSYDRFTNDVPYSAVADFLEQVLAAHNRRATTVLDLACGTGSLSCLLAQRGYRVLGTDCSEEMLTVAYEKALELSEERPLFVHQRMQHLRLPEPVSCAVCTLDSLNYLTDPKECQETIRRVFRALEPGGCFVFDINTVFKLRSLDGQIFLDEDDDQYCVWRANFEEKENICYYGMDIFQRRGVLWERSFEEHAEYAYSVEQLTTYLAEAGFSEIAVYADRCLAAPQQDALRIYFFAGKDSE